jgi:FkbM family methyltransferase
MRRFIKPGDVVFDIGAHRGDWPEAVLSRVGPSTIHAFEALPEISRALEERVTEDAALVLSAPNSRHSYKPAAAFNECISVIR